MCCMWCCMWLATTLANPCTEEALKNDEYYHAHPLDSHFFVQCDGSGFPHIRPCPPSLVWSTDETTCVRKSTEMNQDNMQQGSWQPPPPGAQNPWSVNAGSNMNDNNQQSMVRYRPRDKDLFLFCIETRERSLNSAQYCNEYDTVK